MGAATAAGPRPIPTAVGSVWRCVVCCVVCVAVCGVCVGVWYVVWLPLGVCGFFFLAELGYAGLILLKVLMVTFPPPYFVLVHVRCCRFYDSGAKTTWYERAKLEQCSPFAHPLGLIARLSLYDDAARTMVTVRLFTCDCYGFCGCCDSG